jgi:hypothetical protein
MRLSPSRSHDWGLVSCPEPPVAQGSFPNTGPCDGYTPWRRILDVMRSARVALAVFAVGLAAGCASSHQADIKNPPKSGRSRASFPTAMRVAKASHSMLSIFAPRPGVTPCRIPDGATATSTSVLKRFVPGRCRTSVRVAPTHEPALIVTFTESWPRCLQGYCPGRGPVLRRHTWHIMVSLPFGRTRQPSVVTAKTRSTGALPPQDYQ